MAARTAIMLVLLPMLLSLAFSSIIIIIRTLGTQHIKVQYRPTAKKNKISKSLD